MATLPEDFYIETIHKNYIVNDPVFFDKSKYSWARDLEKNFSEIKNSLSPIFKDDFKGLIVNPEVHIQFPPKLWKGYPFYFNGLKIQKHLKPFPYLAAQLEKIPHLITASISVLEPGAWLLPHNGSTNAIMRIHLPLKVPALFPECGMTIAGHDLSWKEGDLLFFCDMQVHSVRNLTNERRFILMLDVMRPEFVPLKKLVCVHTTSRIVTNIIRNLFKSLLHIPFKKQNPNKEKLEYVANKNYVLDATEKSKSLKDKMVLLAEDILLNIIIGFSNLYYLTIKLQ
jgi:hypothetical protein